MLNWLRRKKTSGPVAAAPVTESAPVPAPTTTPEQATAMADELMRKAFQMHQEGNVAGAERLYREILAIVPDYADAHYLLGRLAQDRQQPDEAIQHVRRAIRSNNREVAFQKTLGELHFGLGHWDEAVVYFGNAVDLEPEGLETWNNLGCSYQKLGKLADATRCFEKAVAISANSPMAINNVAMSLQDRGRIDEAIPAFKKAHSLAPDDRAIFSNYLYALNFSPRISPAECFEAHLEFDARFGTGRPVARPGPALDPDPDPDRRLRIAYFSPDLRSHPVSVFIEGPLVHHGRDAFEVSCYHLYPTADVVTQRLKTLADSWIECRGLSDEQIADRIVQDRIDILVELAGHTGDNRSAVLGMKPAPVIVSWLGYPNTTGLKTVDYKLTDAVCDPAGVNERYHTETLIRLPQQWCFARPEIASQVTPLPALTAGHIRFSSFNNSSKLTVEMLRLWGEILQRVAGSTLFVWGVGEEHRERIRQALRDAGVDPSRADFSDRTGFPKQVAMYQGVDIALDTFPYSGVTTSFNSLWMGVPIVTLAGETSASRSTFSILSGLGLSDWGAHSPAEYVELAVRKAGDVAALAALRTRLRQALEKSAFMDAPGFTRHLEDAYRQMWRTRCRSAASA